ncbi:MAG: dihydroorotase [Vampirovibrionales bacterium]|nr:dihydroorotase [Vampirovibrionales bacterium]
MKLLLKGGRVLMPALKNEQASEKSMDALLDVLIEDGRITAIGDNLSESDVDTVIQLKKEQWVTPGLVDIHVHFRDPGQGSKETIATGALAAAAGGFTTVCMMPNTSPTIDSVSVLEYVEQAARKTKINVLTVPAVTKGLEGKELTAMGTLVSKGAVAFSDDGMPIESAGIMRKALEYAKMFGVAIVCHAEDPSLCGCGVMHEGYYSTRLGLPGIPSSAESTMVARDIELARQTGGHVHFAHLSCKESVALIRQAKKEGLNVTSETTPHNLALTDATICDYDPNFKMYGPLRAADDQAALIEGILDGTIDAIATDHAPHTPEEKLLTFNEAPRGVIGLETSLGVILTHFYHSGKLSALDVVRLMSTAAAECYGLKDAGILRQGMPADITVIDPELSWTVDPNRFFSKSKNCPFNGQTLQGKAILTIAKGEIVYDESGLLDGKNQAELLASV